MNRACNRTIWLSGLAVLCLAGSTGASPVTDDDRGDPAAAIASKSGNVTADKTFGVLGVSSVTVHAMEFEGVDASAAADFQSEPGFQRSCASPGCSMAAGVHVPNGVRIKGIEVDILDDNADARVTARLLSCEVGVQLCDEVASAGTTFAGQPGRTQVLETLSIGPTVDNVANSYVLSAGVSGTSTTDASVVAVRVFFRRQISPPPASASFGDVPTDHPFFQHVEALAESGITAGCGDGDFCPDQTVTRGQMAVFLAKALGLYWPSLLN